MTMRAPNDHNEFAKAFIEQAREHLTGDYLPKIERSVEKLTEEQIWWRPDPNSNSVGNLILHLCGNAYQWIVCGLGGEVDRRERQAEFDAEGGLNRQELLTRLRNTVASVDQTLSEYDSSRLLAQYPIQGTTATGLAAIFHVTEHFSMHAGQIIFLTKLLTASDLRFYGFEGDKPVHRWRSHPSRSS